ncbi:MAG: hypothetical protein KF858_17175 [Candidatus Sumerlaeia bacterium]|nr:hypothetical protein [Candidatus Sumerlaeia bacterium]
MTRATARWIALAVGAAMVVAGSMSPRVVGLFHGGPRPLAPVAAEAVAAPADCAYLLVIGRRPERSAEEEELPHRNSRLALYERDAEGWRKIEGDLPVRSHSTSRREPLAEELNPRTDKSREFGYVSVPVGVFTLAQAPWRDGVTPAFLISDWGRFDGTIGLREPQVIRRATLHAPEGGEPEIRTEVIRSSIDKTGSWLHPTFTQYWSFGDSNGCINLFRPHRAMAGAAPADYDVLLGWLDARGLVPGRESLLPLVIAPFNYVGDPATGLLHDRLSATFYENLPDRGSTE